MEKRFKGTKGKWRAYRCGLTNEILAEANGVIADVCNKNQDNGMFDLRQANADAKLMATSKELLEFAMFIAKHEKGSAPSAGYFQEMIEKAEAVIEKALNLDLNS